MGHLQFSHTDQGLNVAVFERVITSGFEYQRLALAKQLCALVNSEATPAIEVQEVMPVLIKLACDDATPVRRVVSTDLLQSRRLAPELIFAVAADDDEVAVPFLKINPSVDSQVMRAILTVGDAKRCAAIAGRADISSDAVRQIVRKGDADLVVALMHNEKIRLGRNYCKQLYNRFYDLDDVCTVLMKLPTLPAEIALVHNQRIAHHARVEAELNGWYADEFSDDFITDNEERTALKIVDQVEDQELSELVALMSDRGMLTTSLLLRAGISGRIDFFEIALSYLSAVSLRRTRLATSKPNARMVSVLLRKAAIPEDTHDLFAAICHAAAIQDLSGQCANGDVFGRTLIEVIMTRHAADGPKTRARLVSIVEELSAGKTRNLVKRLNDGAVRLAA